MSVESKQTLFSTSKNMTSSTIVFGGMVSEKELLKYKYKSGLLSKKQLLTKTSASFSKPKFTL